MTSEKINVEFTVYRTPDGEPTCAVNWGKGERCEFAYTAGYEGLQSVCKYGAHDEELEREPNLGYLVPHSGCPLWRGKGK